MIEKSSIRNSFVLFFVFSCLIFLPSTPDAAYKIYLKNGSVIKNINHYEKKQGEIVFRSEGGTIGIPEEQILKIEGTGEYGMGMQPPAKAAPKEDLKNYGPEKVRQEMDEKYKPAPETIVQPAPEKDSSAEEIAKKEAELKRIEADLSKTMIGVQSLYLKMSRGTISGAERSMLSQSMAKKRKLEEEKKKIEEELKNLREKQ